MKQVKSPVLLALRVIAMFALLCGMSAQADEYSDVSQLVRAGKLPEALARADQYLAVNPKDPQMRFMKGVIQRDTGKTADAIATFTRLTEDYPELPEPYNNLAVLYAGQSQFDKARNALEMAIRTNPSYATAHENLGDIYAKLASQAYNKALQLDNANQAVPPKLALIREIFGAKGQKPAITASSAAPAAAASTAPAPAPVKPAPVAPTPAATPAPAPAPAPTPVAATPVKPAVVVAAPAAPAPPPPAPPAPASDNAGTKEVETSVAAWARAWSARDVKTYLAAYGKDFVPPGGMARKAWEEERQQRIASKASISVKVDKLSVSVKGNHAVAKFRQDYKAGGLAVNSSKTLEFTKVGDQWQIVKETVGN